MKVVFTPLPPELQPLQRLPLADPTHGDQGGELSGFRAVLPFLPVVDRQRRHADQLTIVGSRQPQPPSLRPDRLGRKSSTLDSLFVGLWLCNVFSLLGLQSVDLNEKHGIEVVIPSEEDRLNVHQIIYDELCLGQINQVSKERYCQIMRNLVRRGAQGIVLGCTEIGLLVGADDSPVPVFDTTKIHAEAAVEYALAE